MKTIDALRRGARIARFRQTMRWHIMRLVIGAAALGLAAQSGIAVTLDVLRAQALHHEKAVQIAESASAAARVNLALYHDLTLSEILQELGRQNGVSSVEVHDLRRDLVISDREPISRSLSRSPLAADVQASATPQVEARAGQLVVAAPIRAAGASASGPADGSVIGVAMITIDSPALWDLVGIVALPTIIAFVLAMALLVPVAARSARQFVKPLRAMSDMAFNIAHGSFDTAAPKSPIFEIRTLARSLTRMSAKLQQQLERIHQLAFVDQVTSLPNRERFRHQFDHALATERAGAVLFIDLDRFKIVNDTLGHEAGDELLRIVARRLTAALRTGDPVGRITAPASERPRQLVARLGGDEFTILLPGVQRPEDAAHVARKLIDVIGKPVQLKSGTVTVGASVGIALFTADGADYNTLLKHADLAMYAAKEAGRGAYAFFSSEMNERMQMRLTLEREMREGLERGEFTPFYQPKVDINLGRPVGVEAVVRWAHPERGMLAPDQFIEIAEDSGLMGRIGEAVVRKACADAATWVADGHPVPVAVNVSMAQFRDEAFVDMLMQALDDSGLPPKLLEIEVAETTAMAEPVFFARLVEPLRRMGVRTAIDDFGTGYSNLGHLINLPFDIVKIDRSFVSRLPADRDARTIVKTILGMARSLGYLPVAEGVETQDQAGFLRAHGCTVAQGFLFARPMPTDRLTAWLGEALSATPHGLHARLEREVGGR